MRCPECCNPELQAFTGGTEWRTDILAERILATSGIEGVSFLGGEPMSQPAAVLDVARRVRARGLSVMIFTGFTLSELRARRRADIDALLDIVDLLVDGRYEADRPDHKRRWIGSENQVMHFCTDRYSPIEPRFYASDTVEIRLSSDGLMVNGWPQAANAVLSLLPRVHGPTRVPTSRVADEE